MTVIKSAGDILFLVLLAILIVKLLFSFRLAKVDYRPGQKVWLNNKQYTVTEFNIGGAGLTVEIKMERTTLYNERSRRKSD